MTPIAEDFANIAAELKRIEQEKARVLSVPLPEVQPRMGYQGYLAQDYDGA
jgi:hypothetical protein